MKEKRSSCKLLDWEINQRGGWGDTPASRWVGCRKSSPREAERMRHETFSQKQMQNGSKTIREFHPPGRDDEV